MQHISLWALLLVVSLAGCMACWGGSSGGGSSGSGSTTSNREKIAVKADSYIGSELWSFASSHQTGPNTNKCNIFVAEVIEQAGGSVPHRHWYTWSPIGAREWEKADSSYLTSDSCWSRVTSAVRGDVAALDGHVAIVTESSMTTSASAIDQEVVKNNWGFKSGQSPTFWSYVC